MSRPAVGRSLTAACAMILTVGLFATADAAEITVLSPSAEIKASDGRILARPRFGTKLKSLGQKKSYYQVEWSAGKQTLRGWIHRGHVLPPNLTAAQRNQLDRAAATSREGDEPEKRGDIRAAIAPRARAMELYIAVLGRDHISTAKLRNDLALLYDALGDYARAESLYRQSLEITKKILGKQHRDYATSLNNLAMLYDNMGDYARAESLHRESLEIRKRILGHQHPHYANSLNNLAILYAARGDYARAESLYRESLEIIKKVLGEQDPNYAASLNNLAELYRTMGDHARAEPLLRDSLEIRKNVLGEQHPEYAQSLNNLAFLYSAMGDYARAEPLFRESLKIKEQVLGEQHPDYALGLNNLATMLGVQRQWDEAADLLDLSRRAARGHVVHVVPGLSDRQQAVFLGRQYVVNLGKALSLSLAWPDDAKTARIAAEWATNGKGMAQEARSRTALLARQTDDPVTADLARQLRSAEQRLAHRALQVPEPALAAGRLAELQRLSSEQTDLSQRLGQHIGRDLRLPDWIDLRAVEAALPAGQALVEIVRFPAADFEKRKLQGDRYAAWIVPPANGGDVRFVDLGVATAIDAAVGEARRAIEQSSVTLREQGEPAATAEADAALRALGALVFDPLRSELGDARSLILSPDSNLWLVPWAALPLDDGRLLIEDYTLRYAITGRDLLRKAATVQRGVSVAMADPDYGLSSDEVTIRAAALKSPPADPMLKRASAGLGAVQFARLPGTRAEAQAIAPALATWCGQAPRVLLGAEAIEGAAKQAQSPRVLLLSTHGFFLPEQEEKVDERESLTSDDRRAAAVTVDGQPLENPLLRCGLALAGANTRGERTDDSTDDGILTGLEIVGMDLRGTELVVLSACETGLGDVRNGEGVAGLRQAFQLAGAEAVVATLWQIPDRDTAIIMGDFFANLAAGQSKAEALRKAQLKRIADRRERHGAAHPLFWAAFTLTGH